MLQHLPLWLCDVLRILESRINEYRSHNKAPLRIGSVALPAEVVNRLPAAPVLLLVDDAIDTGATIQQAREQLVRQLPNADVRVAVITVTTSRPMCDADFCLYHNRTLCRFPWSNDYRKSFS